MAVRVAFEHHFHSSEQVSEYLAQAVSIMEAHELDPTVCPELTAQLVGLLAAKHTELEAVSPLGLPLRGGGL